MVAEQIETMKREYTDKYVVVDAARPELARFRDVVGQVRTVNMSGRALVEFVDYHLNIGWYDIDLAFLKVVDKPLPKAAKPKEEKPAAKAAAEKPAAAAKPAAAPKAGKPSVADILAAARGGGEATSVAAKAKADAKGKPEAKSLADTAKPAAKPPAAAPAKVDRSKMSVADMIAAARAGGAPGAAAATAQPAPAPAEEAAAPAPTVAAKPAPAKPAAAPKSSEKVDKSKMSIDDMVAWCRQHDSK